jgi:hypothetical protein
VLPGFPIGVVGKAAPYPGSLLTWWGRTGAALGA